MGILISFAILPSRTMGQYAQPQIIPDSFVQDELVIITKTPVVWDECSQSIEGVMHSLPMGSTIVGCADKALFKQDAESTAQGMYVGTSFLVKLPTSSPYSDAQSALHYVQECLQEPTSIISVVDVNRVGALHASSPVSYNDPEFANSQYHRKYDLTAIANGVKYTGWQHATGYKFKNTSKVLIAVLDAGLRFTHQDVQNAYWVNSSESSNSSDDDSNGYVDDINGWDFVNNDNDPTDDNTGNWHGTHVFGIIAARNNNSYNICGMITDTLSTMVLKVGNASGSVTDFWTASGYNYALAKGARIMNMSFGFNNSPTLLMNAIANGVANYKAVPVASVGNTGNQYYGYPASGANVITVGNASYGGTLYTGSSYSDSVDVTAAGVSVRSLLGNSNTASGNLTGSSMAAPHVSGFVWWILKMDTSLTVQQVTQKIRSMGMNGSFVSGQGWGYVVGLDTLCYNTMMPDTSVTLSKCGGMQPLPVTKVFQIVDSERYGVSWIVNDSVNTNVAPTGTFDYKMAWESAPRSSVSYNDTFRYGNKYLHFTVSGSGGTTPSTTVLSSKDTMCVGDTLHITRGGNTANAKRKWYKNSTLVDTSVVYIDTATTAGVDTIKLVVDLSTTGTCWTKAYDTTTKLIVKNATVTPSVSISANPGNTICSGTSVTFTASPTNGGSSPSYQWKVGSTNVGTNSNTYTSSTLSNNDVVSCIMTPTTGGCYTSSSATSNTITMTVNTPVTPSVSISANPGNTICAGTSVTFTASPTNGGSSASYQWKVNSSNVGTNSTTFSSSTLSNNDVVSCVMTTSLSCVTSGNATSNTVTMSVTNNVTPTVSIAPTSTTICEVGGSATLTASTTISGVSYQWYRGTTPVGTNSNTHNVSGISPGTHSYTVQITVPNGCFTSSTATSNTASITVNAATPVNSSANASSLSICNTVGDTITANCSVTGATVLKWQHDDGTGFVDVIGSNGTYYAPSGLSGGTHKYRAIYTMPTGCYTQDKDTTNEVSISVTEAQAFTASLAGTDAFVQAGVWKGLYTLTLPVGLTSYTVKWYRIINGQPVLQTTLNDIKTWVRDPLDNDHPDTVYAVVIPKGCWDKDSTLTNQVIVTASVSVAALPKLSDDYRIYPNPATTQLFITGLKRDDRMIMTNAVGQQVLQYTFVQENNPTQINLSGLPNGIYMVRFISHDGQPYAGGGAKIIKQE